MRAEEQGFYARLGTRVREMRRCQSLTQEALADLWRLDRTTVVNIEKGRQRVSVHQLAVLAEHLGCSLGDLIPELEHRDPLSPRLKRQLPDEGAVSFVTQIAAAGRRQG